MASIGLDAVAARLERAAAGLDAYASACEEMSATGASYDAPASWQEADDVRRVIADGRAMLAELRRLRALAAETFHADALLVARYVVGWWPGLEDGIAWGGAIYDDPTYLAARRMLGMQPPSDDGT